MNIPPDQWQAASGTYVIDRAGKLWRIIGFFDRPAVLLEPVREDMRLPGGADERQCATVIMGTPHSEDFTRLVPEK